MAVEKLKATQNAPMRPMHTMPKKSRNEMNVRQLLNKCEYIAKQEPVDSNWRLKQYVESLNEMIAELKTGPE